MGKGVTDLIRRMQTDLNLAKQAAKGVKDPPTYLKVNFLRSQILQCEQLLDDVDSKIKKKKNWQKLGFTESSVVDLQNERITFVDGVNTYITKYNNNRTNGNISTEEQRNLPAIAAFR